MLYDFTVDPITKKKIVVFRCTTTGGFPKNGLALAKFEHGWEYYQCNNSWEYYQCNNSWLYNGWKTAFVFNTQEEAELACTQHLNFLKECS